jgi:hypothetical protein
MGEVWCMTLREARANLINKYGWAVGNQLIMQLVTDGMKLGPANPNFLQARDAILQADQVDNGGADLWELWTAFAKRGMGHSATSPSSSTTTGLHEAYDVPLLPLGLTLPANATEGDGVLTNQGLITLSAPTSTNLAVSLTSSDTSEITVPSSVTVLAGQTNATFNITVIDDGQLDGTQTATVTATAPSYAPANATLLVYDNETATLQVVLPATATEGQGTASGTVLISAVPAANIVVGLSSSDITEIQVPTSVTIPAGQTSAVFTATVVDDNQIDGPQAVTVTAHVQNWTDGSTNITVLDNENLNLAVTLPASAWENVGVLTNAGSVGISGTLTTDLVVSVVSDMTNRLMVPSGVTIPAGQVSNTFDLTLVDNSVQDGDQTVTVTASVSGFANGTTSMVVKDDEVAPVIMVQPANQLVGVGGTATFGGGVVSSYAVGYQWYYNGAPLSDDGRISGSTTASLAILNTQTNDSGLYNVVVTNVFGSATSSNAILTAILCMPAPSGLVDWWPGEGNANDTAGTNNGTLVNGAGFAAGEVGQAFSLDGVQSYVSIPDSPSLDSFISSITIEAWIKVTQFSPSQIWTAIVTKGDSSWRLHRYGLTSRISFSTDGLSNVDLDGNKSVDDGQWHHVAAVYDGTNKFIYVDGTLDISTPATGSISQNNYPVCIGENAQMTGRIFDGLIDEVSLYNRALTASEIQAIYAAGSEGKCYTPAPPVILTQPPDQTVMVGGSATFNVTASGTLPLAYQWNFNGTNIVGATNTSLTLTNVQLYQAGNYTVLVTNAYGSILSSNAVLTVNLPPPVPVITGFSPISGPVGISVTISGTNFNPVAASNIVYFGAVRATVSAASATNLVVTVPVEASYAPITETVNGLTAYANAPFLVTFTGSGVINSASLTTRVDLASGNSPATLVIADLDGDGKPDLAVNNGSSHTISIYRNISTNGSLTAGSFAPRVDLPINSGGENVMVAADVDGDGKLDLVLLDYNANQVMVLKNLCTPGNITTSSFGSRVSFSVGSAPRGVAVRDLDGDGKPEIVVANWNDSTISVLRNIGTTGILTTNSFAPAVVFATGPNPQNAIIADVDGDGKADVVTVNTSSSSGAMSVLRNLSTLGNIAFATNVNFPGLASSYSLAIGDLDGDGRLDVVIGSQPSGQSVSVFRNTSTPGSITTSSFAAHVDFATGGWANSVAIGDLDGDGKPDVAAVTQSSSHLSLFKNTSTPGSFTNSSFAARVDFSTGSNPNGVAIGDLDGDGRPDIVFANSYSATISVYQNMVPFRNLPPVITTQPTNQTVVVGGTASFSVTASGTPPLSYQWRFGGTNISGATNTTLILTNVQVSQAGNYTVLVTNLSGSIFSSNAVLTVTLDHFAWNPIPSPRFVNTPFAVTIRAQNPTNGIFTNFTGTAILGTTNGIAVTPSVSGNFVQGVWTGAVVIAQTASNLVLRANDGLGHFGLANPINVVSLPSLGMLHSGNIAVYMWPVGYSGFVLETSGSLAPAAWVVVPHSPIQIGDQYVLPLDMTGTNGFYRLQFSNP